MSLSDSKLLIRDYSDIRDILRDIYIFGCFSRDDYISRGISGRKYDNEQRRITSYLPEKFIKKKREGKRVVPYCLYDMTAVPENFLAETYRNKSFTLLDIMSYFFVMTILNAESEMSLSEILEVLPEESEEIIYTKDNLRKKLDELIDKGLIRSEKKGRNVVYKITEDYLSDFENEELVNLYWLLEFVKNVCPLEMPFFFLQRKLKLYLYAERDIAAGDIRAFQYKHNHLFNVLDNEVMMTVLEAIHGKRILKIKYAFKGEEYSHTVVPVKIIHECTYGRQYLLYYDLKEEKSKIRRIDRMVSVDMMHAVSKEVLETALRKSAFEENVWCASGVDLSPEEVKIEFHIDEEKEQYVLERIKREGRKGKLEKITPGVYIYSINVSDSVEMIPWIRSFGERAKVIYSRDGALQKRLLEDYERAIAKYEAI